MLVNVHVCIDVCMYMYLSIYFFRICKKKVKSPLIPPSGDDRCQPFVMHLSASLAMYIYNFFSKMGPNYTY